jgi:hypothetical protein
MLLWRHDMPHITDGLLHAYLDGAVGALTPAGEAPDGPTVADVEAHLQACADCRARLEAERAVRAAAGLVLADAGGSVEVPPFDALLPDMAVRSVPRRRRTWLPLAWAASLFLALGAGWWAASTGGSSAAPQRVAELAESRAQPPRTAGTANADEPDAVQPDAASLAATAADAPPTAVTSTADPRPAGALAVGASDNAAGARAGAGAGATAPAADARVARAEAPTEAVADAADRGAARPVGEPVARLEPTVVTGIAPPVMTGRMPPSAAALRTPGVQALRSEQSFQAGRVPDVVVHMLQAAGAERDAWTHLELEQRVVGGVPVLAVADAGEPAASFRVDSVAGTVIRVWQELAGGDSIELLIWRAQPLARSPLARSPSARSDTRARSITGGVEQARPDAAVVGPVLMSSEVLASGDTRLVVLLPDRDVLVALRGAVPDGRLMAAAGRLVERR